MRRVSLLIGCLGLIVSSTSWAQAPDDSHCPPTAAHCEPQAEPDGPSFDARLDILADLAERGEFDSPLFGAHNAPAHMTEESVGVTLRFAEELSDDDVTRLEEKGVDFRRRDGDLVEVGSVYAATVRWEALEALADEPTLERVEADWLPTRKMPLEETSELVGAAQARKLPELPADGEGVTVVDVDAGFDVLHPHLFRADGGFYEWNDANDNGEFDPGEDTVEVDGQEGPLRVLDGTTTDRTLRDIENDDGKLQPDRDWVYLDLDDDGERDVGPDEGFEESDPAYGEPIFVVDDVDRNGKLDPGEKLVRLETSKFRKIVVDGEAYERGEDLIEANEDQQYLGHGTSVTSTVGGGQPGYHRRVGLAPEVDFIGYAYLTEAAGDPTEGRHSIQMDALDDALEEDSALVLHEWNEVVTTPADGSSNLEQAMDDAHDEGVNQITPVGNLNSAEKHVHREVRADDSVELGFHVDDGVRSGGQQLPHSTVYTLIQWRENNEPAFMLVSPDGEEHEIDFTSQSQSVGDAQLYAERDQTERGTRFALLTLSMSSYNESLPQGDWTIRLNDLRADDEVTARISDMHTQWTGGIVWDDPTADYGTICYPASADLAFGVAAYAGRHGQTDHGEDSGPGQLRSYSGRGPRIDGEPVLDIAAPDDPYAAMGADENVLQAGAGRSWFRTFGGTSGAAPHVAAAVALARQQDPDAEAGELEESLRESADTDDLAPHGDELPNHYWGAGRLDVFDALTDEEPPDKESDLPQAHLNVEEGGDAFVLDASDSEDADGDPLEYRFDVDYDGEWDTDWTDESTHTEDADTFQTGADYRARVEVRDPQGERAGALDEFSGPKPAIASGQDDDGCGCSTGRGPQPGAVLLAVVVVVFGGGRLLRGGFRG